MAGKKIKGILNFKTISDLATDPELAAVLTRLLTAFNP